MGGLLWLVLTELKEKASAFVDLDRCEEGEFGGGFFIRNLVEVHRSLKWPRLGSVL